MKTTLFFCFCFLFFLGCKDNVEVEKTSTPQDPTPVAKSILFGVWTEIQTKDVYNFGSKEVSISAEGRIYKTYTYGYSISNDGILTLGSSSFKITEKTDIGFKLEDIITKVILIFTK